jgi:hypothetical protein
MAIPNHAKPMRSGVVGTLANDGPKRVKSYVLNYEFNAATENHATPSRAVSEAADGTVHPGKGNNAVFAGLILGNQRVLSKTGESWFASGAVIEVISMGPIFVNIDNSTDNPSSAAKVGGKVYFEATTGKLFAGSTSTVEIKGAIITEVDAGDKPTRLCKITLTGNVA